MPTNPTTEKECKEMAILTLVIDPLTTGSDQEAWW